MTNPRMVQLVVSNRSPTLDEPALAPLISIKGARTKPGWVVPSMMTASVIEGNAEPGVMVCAPVPIWKLMVSTPLVALASRMAWRSEPAPLSLVVVTTNVAPGVARPCKTIARKANAKPERIRIRGVGPGGHIIQPAGYYAYGLFVSILGPESKTYLPSNSANN